MLASIVTEKDFILNLQLKALLTSLVKFGSGNLCLPVLCIFRKEKKNASLLTFVPAESICATRSEVGVWATSRGGQKL